MEFKYDVKAIQDIFHCESIIAAPHATIEWLLIDSRKIIRASSSLFFALKGKTDAMQYLPYLVKQGVYNFVVSQLPNNIKDYPACNFYVVADTLKALQLIATAHRKQFDIPVIGITGSNGKTIVKDWLYQLLNPEYAIARSPKSYNSQIGVPLSVWQIASHNNLAIIEAGISTTDEMDALANIIQPSIGVLTNIKTAHAEGFQDKAAKLAEKLKLFANCKQVVMPLDYVPESLVLKNAFTWSASKPADLSITAVQKENQYSVITASYLHQNCSIRIPFVDDAAVENAITCWAVMLAMGYDQQVIATRFPTLPAIQMRLELKQGIHQTSIINDSYSADIESLYIAVDFLNQQQQYTKKTIILSDFSAKLAPNQYQEIAAYLQSKGIQKFIGIGPVLHKQKDLFQFDQTFFYEQTSDFLASFDFTHFQRI